MKLLRMIMVILLSFALLPTTSFADWADEPEEMERTPDDEGALDEGEPEDAPTATAPAPTGKATTETNATAKAGKTPEAKAGAKPTAKKTAKAPTTTPAKKKN